MNWFFRMRLPVRLALVGVAVIVLVVAARSFVRPTDEAPLEDATELADLPVNGPSSSAPVASAPASGLAALGAPDDPLPSPLSLPPAPDLLQSSDAIDGLAQRVLAGTPESLPALIAALQASGIGILGPLDASDVKPAEPWQGIAMRRWEVRTAAAMVLPDRTVLFTLPDLAAFLVAAFPQLKGAPIEQLLVNDLRALADSPVPTNRFFGRFIAALGRDAVNHQPYDLLTDVNPQTMELNGLQVSLILRRLALDIMMVAGDDGRPDASGKKSASIADTLRRWIAPVVFAQGSGSCALSERTQSIADTAAFGSSMAWGGFSVGEMGMPGLMQRFGLDRLSSAVSIASSLLGYAQFIATYAALKADVSMDRPPLVRTKKPSPQTGERRELTAIVKLDVGNAQMLNCLRALLIPMGLDFSLGNNGPVKGARVSWYGVEGFDQAAGGGGQAIVQFVAQEGSRIQSGGSASSSPITGAVTGEDGKIQIGVEGRGQHRRIAEDAARDAKSAKMRLHVALKGSDLFADLQEAAGTAAGGLVGLATLPLSVLYRAQWATVGHHTFPVIDWKDGPPEWTGTVIYTKTTQWNESQTPGGGVSRRDYNEVLTLTVNATGTAEGASVFGDGAQLRATAQAEYTKTNTHSWRQPARCGKIVGQFTGTTLDSSQGAGAGTAKVVVGISADGKYSITVSPEVTVAVTNNYGAEQSAPDGRKQCQPGSQSTSSSHAGSWQIGGSEIIQGDGTLDPNTPNRLSGRTTERDGNTTRTVTWDLRRQ